MTEQYWEEDKLDGRWEVFRGQPNNGRVEWHGGAPPFSDGNVDVRLRSGGLIRYRSALGIGRRSTAALNWAHLGDRQDFIAYRRHVEPPFTSKDEVPIPF